MRRTSKGDLCIAYLSSAGRGPSAIKAVFRIASGLKAPDSVDVPTMWDHMYPNQVDITIETEADRAVPFKPLVEQIGFIREARHWGAYLQGCPMRQLTSEDFNVLQHAIRQNSPGPGLDE